MSKKITITISKDGSEIKSDATGFQGGECLQKAEALLRGLGQETESIKKSEFYLPAEQILGL